MQGNQSIAITSTHLRDIQLHCHPHTACTSISVSCDIQRREEKLILSYKIVGDISVVLVPDLKHAARTDELWRHSCAELFVGALDSEKYLEFNFAPTSQWAAYEFEAYRRGLIPLMCDAPKIETIRTLNCLAINVSLVLQKEWASKQLQVGISMVIENKAGQCSYWAMRHGEKPDFHQRDHWLCHL